MYAGRRRSVRMDSDWPTCTHTHARKGVGMEEVVRGPGWKEGSEMVLEHGAGKRLARARGGP